MRTVSRTAAIVAFGAVLTAAGGITALALADHHDPPAAAASNVASAPTPPRVISVTPANGSSDVDGTNPVTVTFSAPLPAGQPFPRLSPAVPGTWARSGNAAVFTPASGFPGSAKVRVSVPGAVATTRSGYSSGFSTKGYSTLRLQQVLAQMGYLPMTWSAYLGGTVTPGSLAAQASAAYSPPPGSFGWKHGYPGQMYGLWKEGKPNLLDTGAIAGFEADHGMRADGVAGSAFWAALLKAAAAGQRNRHGYSYAIASESIPESLSIWHNGHQVFYSPANTGIGSRPTATGTYFVYEKLPYQIMQGTNPDGSHYSDPVAWVSYFNGGDAVHYFPRGSFGWPQSLGCVELPYGEAERSYGYLPLGTVVSVNP